MAGLISEKQVNAPCVGGPLDGQWWPLETGAPTIPVRRSMPLEVSETDGPPRTTDMFYVRYRARDVREPNGRPVTVFAPEDWPMAKLLKHLSQVAPQGI